MSAAIDTNLETDMKFTLMILADNAAPDGTGYVALPFVAEKCSLSLDRVKKIIHDFFSDGMLIPYDFGDQQPRSPGFSFRIVGL